MDSLRRLPACLATGSGRRIESFHRLTGEDEDEHQADTSIAAENLDQFEAGQQQGVPWTDLEVFFGEDVRSLSMDTVVTEADGVSHDGMKWNENNIRKLIDHLGPLVISRRAEDQTSLVIFAVVARQLQCAKLLFDYAAEFEIHVGLIWNGGDILGWSLTQKSKRLMEFVLQRMAEKCASPLQTAACLGAHFERLCELFPETAEKYIQDDAFSFEHGKIQVRQKLFTERPDAAIAILSEVPALWKSSDSDEVKDFWTEQGLGDYVDLDSHSGVNVTAVSKFLCVNLSSLKRQRSFINSILTAGRHADIFKTESIRHLVQWRWCSEIYQMAWITLGRDVNSTIQFFVFIAVFGCSRDDINMLALSLSRMMLLIALFGMIPPLVHGAPSAKMRLVVLLYLFIHCCVTDHHTSLSLFLTSLQCIIHFVVLIEDLGPFVLTGPFISMIKYVLVDIRPFMLLGTVMTVTFGMAFFVLFAHSFDEDDSQSFNSPWRTFETMFHATLGQFEPEIFYTPSTSFLTVWRSFIFNLYLFLAAVVLLSLLIAVLGDTCDRVMLTKEGESIRNRATFVARKTLKERVAEVCGNACLASVFLPVVIAFDLVAFAPLALLLIVPILLCTCILQEMNLAPIRRLSQCTEQLLAERPNSVNDDSNVLVFRFLVPATSVIQRTGSLWQGRLIALSKLIAEKLSNGEERSCRDMNMLQARISNLESTLEQHVQQTQYNFHQTEASFRKIEQLLEKMTRSMPPEDLDSPARE